MRHARYYMPKHINVIWLEKKGQLKLVDFVEPHATCVYEFTDSTPDDVKRDAIPVTEQPDDQ